MKKRLVLFAVIFTLFISFASASYYADVKIYVEKDGSTSISGTTNYVDFINAINSQKYTSKQGELWVLNISTQEVFENFIYELYLPENSNVNYIKTTPQFRIEQEGDRIKLIGTGENKPFTLIVQYSINPKTITPISMNIFILSFIGIVILVLFIGYFRFFKNRTKNLDIDNQNDIVKESFFDYSILPQRQQDIIAILKKTKMITQKDLEKEMQIPKSSISRNIRTLEIKGIIKKESAGQTNYISLK